MRCKFISHRTGLARPTGGAAAVTVAMFFRRTPLYKWTDWRPHRSHPLAAHWHALGIDTRREVFLQWRSEDGGRARAAAVVAIGLQVVICALWAMYDEVNASVE
jgi:hypothetical protein